MDSSGGNSIIDQLTCAFRAGLTVGLGQHGGMDHGLGMGMPDSLHTKAEVNYRQCDNGNECCANCVSYNQHKCEKVSGKVDPHMVCDEFNAKSDPEYASESSQEDSTDTAESPQDYPLGLKSSQVQNG